MKKRPSTLGMGELFTFPPEPEKVERPSAAEPPDRPQRELALDVTRSWIVEAPAGSGKTGLLIQRYLKLLALPGVEQPEEVLAITFTVKAAGEIRERVLEQLEKAAGSDETRHEFERSTRKLATAVLERDRNHGWNLLDHPRRFNIRTIDSVCAEIARSLPVLSGSAAYAPVEDASSLYRTAAERTLLQLGGEDAALSDALRLILLHRDGNLSQVRQLLAEMLALRDQWGRLVPLGEEMLAEAYLDQQVLPQIERTLADAICIELSRLARLISPHLLHDLSMLAAEMAGQDGLNGAPSPIAICVGLHRAPGETAEDLDHWRALAHLLIKPSGGWRSGFSRNYLQFDIGKDQAKRLGEIVSQFSQDDKLYEALEGIATIPPAKYPEEQWRVVKALFRVLYRALAELQLVFAERGECDFAEPGLVARAALRNEGAALENAVGTKLQHLLVDEMQDTSTTQYELIQLLTQGWDGHSQTVFLVGDPKQSIYLFRQARVERFIQTMQRQRLGDIELGCLYLTANFRSQQSLVTSFNDDFARLFPTDLSEDHPDEAPYVPAQPVRGISPDTENIAWHTQVVPSKSASPEDRRRILRRQARREAMEVRNVIERWRCRPLTPGRTEPWKIAVLVRNRIHLSAIVEELKRQSPIPFRAVRIEQLDERPEILDLFALTRALLHPADRVAWLALLRAPWCGLELAELHLLTGKDTPDLFEKTVEELLLERGQELCEDSCQRLARVWPILQTAIKQHSRLPLSELVERTWKSLGGDLPLSQEQKNNARTYFELLDDLEHHNAIDLSQLRNRLASLYAETSPVPGAVDLLTIHGAKGLEWDVVLVPGLEKRTRTGTSRLLAWNEVASTSEDAASVILAPITGKGRDSEALTLWLNRIQRSRESAESRRLFYVACTRAREELHLFASPAHNQDGSIQRSPGSLLQAAWLAAEPHFVDTSTTSRPLTAPVIAFRSPESESLVLPALAAEMEESPKAILHRLPLHVLPIARFQPAVRLDARPRPLAETFQRPEGSFEARAFGTAVHAFLEVLSADFASGTTPDSLLELLPSWRPRIVAVLRNEGLSPQIVDQLTGRVQNALLSTLRDPVGVWLLSAHKNSSSEQALTSWHEEISHLRLDRTFSAGEKPLFPGEDHLWIVDYKTTHNQGSALNDFLSQERQKYAAQLEAYGKTMLPRVGAESIRLALYYPVISGFIWWPMPLD